MTLHAQRNRRTLTELETRIAREIEGDIACEATPFDSIARRAGTDEATVLSVIMDLKNDGIIRRFGAVLSHRRAGIRENALVIWAVPATGLERAGTLAARRSEVTHCYERTPPFLGVYTLFTMVHGGKRRLADIIGDMASELGVDDYLVLESSEEYKKASMEYFRR